MTTRLDVSIVVCSINDKKLNCNFYKYSIKKKFVKETEFKIPKIIKKKKLNFVGKILVNDNDLDL
jgi:hypothetical protein